MIQADTIKILIPHTHCSNYSYYKSNRIDKAKQIPGVISILPDRFTGGAIAEINSNIFPMPTLITRYNIADAFNILNSSNLINIHPDALENSFGTTIDATKDNYLSVEDIEKGLKLIKALCYNPLFRKRTYKQNSNTTFYYNQSERGKYAIEVKFYNKEDRLRTEIRFKNAVSIRHHFQVNAQDNLGRILLTDILESTENVVYNAYDKITSNLYNIETEINNMAKTPTNTKNSLFVNDLKDKEALLFFALEKYGFDENELYNFLKPRQPKGKSKAKTLQPYINVLQRYNLYEAELTTDFQLLEQLKRHLKQPIITNANISTLQYAA